jgi:hypothetical protein
MEMELISISTIQIPRAAGWDPTVIVRDYLLGLQLKFMRCVAGFPKEPGQYHLPRAAVEPRSMIPACRREAETLPRRDDPEEMLKPRRR